MIGRIPIALRLALAFAAGLTVVCVGAVWWVHDQQELSLRRIADLSAGHAELLGDSLRDHLLVGMFVLIVVGTLIAWALIAAALRPVEKLRAVAQAYRPDAQHPVLGYTGADDQISRLARTFEGLLARQNAHVARERRLLAEAGHELRTPVATILLEIELALDGKPDRAITMALHSIEEEARHLSTVAEQLLELVRNDAPLEVQQVDVAAIARDRARQATRRFMLDEAIAVSAPQRVHASAHAASLTRALDNVLENAVIHGSAPVRVFVEGGVNGTVVKVFDSGSIGDADELFAPFARGPEAASGTGAGLGLGLARSAMRAMGGNVTLGSIAGHTCATITLPQRR